MILPFWKMHGAGNDFVLFDDRALTFPAADRAWLASLGARRTGVGCDGLVLLQRPEHADIAMRFFNPDGSEADLCGNAARCVARLARDLGAAGERMTIETRAGRLAAEVLPDGVRVDMPLPRDWRMDRTLATAGGPAAYCMVNTGVPHVVVEVADLDACPVAALGAELRYHADFAPAGTNVDFVSVTGPQSCRIRTYERGVEGETLACGTGVTAAALILARRGRLAPPVRVTAAGGDVLTVGFEGREEDVRRVTLLGPAVYVFRGEVEYAP